MIQLRLLISRKGSWEKLQRESRWQRPARQKEKGGFVVTKRKDDWWCTWLKEHRDKERYFQESTKDEARSVVWETEGGGGGRKKG